VSIYLSIYQSVNRSIKLSNYIDVCISKPNKTSVHSSLFFVASALYIYTHTPISIYLPINLPRRRPSTRASPSLPQCYTHTHTHIHTYKYIYLSIHTYLSVYLKHVFQLELLFFRLSAILYTQTHTHTNT